MASKTEPEVIHLMLQRGILLLLAGCTEQPPVPTSQVSPDVTVQTKTVDTATEQTAMPELGTVVSAKSDEITGKVVAIIDGDTIDLLTADKTTIRIRLNGIDAPEKGQPFGNTAKEFLNDDIGGRIAVVEYTFYTRGRQMSFSDDFAFGPDNIAATLRGIHPDYSPLLNVVIQRVALFEPFQLNHEFQIGYTGISVQGWPNALSFTLRFENWKKTTCSLYLPLFAC